MDAQFWEERYRGSSRLFSGEPNGALVDEAAELPPGRALDIGCGEGADAIWLARRGWQVTAIDIASTALERAAAAAPDLSERIEWTRADITVAPSPAGAFDLVSAQYFPLPHQEGHAALHGLLEAVAPGGTLLYVGHDLTALLDERPDFGDYYQPAEIAGLLGPEWTVLVNETRRRNSPASTTPHTHDTVLRARRR